MKRILVFLSISFVVGLNIFLIFKQFVVNNKIIEEQEKSQRIESASFKVIEALKEFYYGDYANVYVKSDCFVNNKDNAERVLLYFSEGNCLGCMIEILNFLEILASKIGPERIYIVSNFRHIEDHRSFLEQISPLVNEKYNFYNCDCLPGDLARKTSISVIGEDMKIKLLFVPEIQPGFQEEYFTNILPHYFLHIK
jgi:hypothetical protein